MIFLPLPSSQLKLHLQSGLASSRTHPFPPWAVIGEGARILPFIPPVLISCLLLPYPRG